MKPAASRQVRVVVLHAGRDTWADFAGCFSALTEAFNTSRVLDFQLELKPFVVGLLPLQRAIGPQDLSNMRA